MQRKKKKNIFNNSLILLGITLMIGSALISRFMVINNEPIITALQNEVITKQTLIRDIWTNVGKKEVRADMAIVLTLLSDKLNSDITEVKKNYLSDFPNLTENSTMLEIISSVSKTKEKDGEYIDNLYLEQIILQRKVTDLEQKNKSYADIALFLQILGLGIIIIKKDIPI
jgi:hypothetical protein